MDTAVLDKTGTVTEAARRDGAGDFGRGGAAFGRGGGGVGLGPPAGGGREQGRAGAGSRGRYEVRALRISLGPGPAGGAIGQGAGADRQPAADGRKRRGRLGAGGAGAGAGLGGQNAHVRRARGARCWGSSQWRTRCGETSAAAIARLHEGLRVVLLTGDNRAAAEHIGAQVGADEVIAEVLPEDKAGVVKSIQERGGRVVMVGDRINDAPALTQADIGCAVVRAATSR